MKAEPRARRDTDALARDDAKHQRARRKAGPIDDYVLAGVAHRHQPLEIGADLASWVAVIRTAAEADETDSAAMTAPETPRPNAWSLPACQVPEVLSKGMKVA